MLLDGLARDTDISESLEGLAAVHPRNDTFPGEVFLRLAGDALEWCGASRAEPLPWEGLRERFLPEATFRGLPRTERCSGRFRLTWPASAGRAKQLLVLNQLELVVPGG
jgi:hypothetical protein